MLFGWVLYWKPLEEINLPQDNFKIVKFSNQWFFIVGDMDMVDSRTVIMFFSRLIFKSKEAYQFDISIKSEDKIWVNQDKMQQLKNLKLYKYMQLRYVWEQFGYVLEKHKTEAICVREAETIFGIKSIKVDFLI